MSRLRSGSILLLVGTSKGAFIFRSDERRRKWSLDGPFFRGLNVHHFVLDPRDRETLFAATFSDWWGCDIQRSRDGGRTWQRTKGGVRYAKNSGLSVKCVWHIRPGSSRERGVVYAGVDPAGLFRSEDGGNTWEEVLGINRHPTRKRWFPGKGGLILHSIVPESSDGSKMSIAISAAGVFRTENGGRTWEPRNRGTRADFLPNKFPVLGQCVHKLVLAADRKRLYQQNHCGVYRSDSNGETWQDISRGLLSRFGFCMAAHPRETWTAWVVPMTSSEFRACLNGRLAAYRTRDGGKTWRSVSRGLPERNAHLLVLREAMSTDSADPAGVYFGTATGQIFHSRDEGREWRLLADCLPPIYSVEGFGP